MLNVYVTEKGLRSMTTKEMIFNEGMKMAKDAQQRIVVLHVCVHPAGGGVPLAVLEVPPCVCDGY